MTPMRVFALAAIVLLVASTCAKAQALEPTQHASNDVNTISAPSTVVNGTGGTTHGTNRAIPNTSTTTTTSSDHEITPPTESKAFGSSVRVEHDADDIPIIRMGAAARVFNYTVKVNHNATMYEFAYVVFTAKTKRNVDIGGLGCGNATMSERSLMCTALGIQSQDDFDKYATEAEEMCAMPDLTEREVCSYACKGAAWARCKSYYLPSTFISAALSTMSKVLSKDREILAPGAVSAAVRSREWRKIWHALSRHLGVIIPLAAICLLYSRDINLFLHIVLAIVAIAVYTYQGLWIQAALAVIIVITSFQSVKASNNNIAVALAGLALAITIVVVDAIGTLQASTACAVLALTLLVGIVAAFVQKRLHFDLSTFVYLILVALAVINGFARIIRRRSDDPYVGMIIYVSGAVLPYTSFGANFVTSQLQSSAWYAINLIEAYGIGMDFFLPITATLWISTFFMWAIVRAIIGYQVTGRARDIPITMQLYRGFLLVFTDLSVFPDIVQILLSLRNTRQLSYSVVVAALKLFELAYAWDMFILSVVLYMLFAVFDYKPVRGSKILSHMPNAKPGAYQCLDSAPWFDFRSLSVLQSNCVKLTLQSINNIQITGSGLLVRIGGKSMLATVKHVAEPIAKGTNIATTHHNTSLSVAVLDKPKYFGHCNHPDPACLIPIIEEGGALDDVHAEIQVLSEGQIPAVSQLMVMHPEGMGNIIPKNNFKIEVEEGIIRADVDLTHGDSGSPVLALTPTGLYLAGVVSRGTPFAGSANLISSFITPVSSLGKGGSPGNSLDTTVRTIDVVITASGGDYNSVTNELKGMAVTYNGGIKNKKYKDKAKKELVSGIANMAAGNKVSLASKEAVLTAVNYDKAIHFNFVRSGEKALEDMHADAESAMKKDGARADTNAGIGYGG